MGRAAVVGGISYVGYRYLGHPPVFGGSGIDLLAGLAVFGMGMSALVFAADTLKVVANICQRMKATMPTGAKGSARLVKSYRELAPELAKKNEPALWLGAFQGRSLRATIQVAAYIVGSAGSGKSSASFIPCIISLFGASMAFVDFKSDVTPMLARFIRQCGGKLIPINMGGLNSDLVGPTQYYNPLINIVELFTTKNGLELIVDAVKELCHRLEPDREAESADTFWIKSNRRWGGACIQFLIVLEGHEATLGGVLQLLNDRPRLLQITRYFAGRLEVNAEFTAGANSAPRFEELKWAASGLHAPEEVAEYADFLRGLASSLCDVLEAPDSRLADSILAGSQEMLSGFEITTRAHKITSKTTVRFNELKAENLNDPSGASWVAFSFMFNPDLATTQAKLFSILSYAMLWELKHHPNKDKNVWFLVDEATNAPLVKVDELLTWGRAYGLRMVFWFQNLARWKKAYGATALDVLESEAEIALIMPATRNRETLERVSKAMGQQSIMQSHYRNNPQAGPYGTELSDYREEGKPVFDPDELRRTKKGALVLRDKPWALIDLYSFAELHPWRSHVDGSPNHGFKPYLKPIKHYVNGKPEFWARAGSFVLNAVFGVITLAALFLFFGKGLS